MGGGQRNVEELDRECLNCHEQTVRILSFEDAADKSSQESGKHNWKLEKESLLCTGRM